MSHANVELCRKAIEAANVGSEAVAAFYTTDAVLIPPEDWIEDVDYRGRDGVRRLNAIWAENFDEYVLKAHEFRELPGERVLTRLDITGRIKGSTVPINQPMTAINSDFREGLIGMTRFFVGWAAAEDGTPAE
jgi:ketosteroid isomerase-like protein